MKPTVINNNSENPHQPQHDQQNVSHNQANNGQPHTDHSRRFPQFRQHGFGFDDPDGDVFADMGLRSRLNRMGNPFDWSARKRRGSGQNVSDAHHYFDDVDFPFGSTWDAFGRVGNKRHPAGAADRSGFFDYVPPELRQYVPENFGGYFRNHDDRQPPVHPHHPQQQPPQQQQPQQQQHQTPPQPQQNYQSSGSKSNLCDAAIQTDDLGAQNNGAGPNNSEHDNRNDGNVNRSSSSASSSSSSTPYGNQGHMSTSADGPGAYGNASAGNNQNQYYQQSPNYANQTPPYGRQYQQPYAHPYQYSQSPQQNQYYTQSTPPPPPPQPQQKQQTSQEGFVRNVPIVLEETGTPVNRSTETSAPPPPPPKTQASSNKTRPEPLNKESFASNEPIPCPPPPASQNQQSQQQHSDNQENADLVPPQTPHTADCISKIQAIQRDVLELMLAVEQFGGKRGDKDYAYLDEMLTRNLLKLDTIDTNGKESIRLARKEAIKCIQTSIAVLEAKSDLNLNEKRDSISIDQTNQGQTEGNASTELGITATEEKPSEKMDVEDANNEQAATNSDAITDVNVEIPKVENISIDDKTSNDNDKPPPTQTEQEQKPDESSATSENADANK